MAHPKSRISKQRKRKRRTHLATAIPTLAKDTTTGESHIYHRAHWVDGNMYYKGKLVIKADDED